MRPCRIVALLFVTLSAHAQKAPGSILASLKNVGTRMSDGKPVIAKQYDLEYDVAAIEQGPNNSSAIIGIKQKSTGLGRDRKLICIDLHADRCTWSKFIHDFDILFGKDAFVYNGLDRTYFFSKTTGVIINSLNPMPGFVARGSNIFISNHEAWDIIKGIKCWEMDLYPRFSYRQTFYADDTTLYLAWAGLHKINLKNGSGWNYKMKRAGTRFGGVKPVIEASSTSIMIGLTIPVGNQPADAMESAMSSNLLYDSSKQRIFFANSQTLVCLDQQGKAAWSYDLPPQQGSYSQLFACGNSVVMLNKGMDIEPIGNVRRGNPFIARFSADTGGLMYLKVFCKSEYVHQYGRYNDTLLVLTSKRLIKFNMADGKEIADVEFNTFKNKVDGSTEDCSGYFVENRDGTFSSLLPSSGGYYVVGETSAFKFNGNLDLVEEIPVEKLWHKWNDSGSYDIISSKDTTAVLQEGKPMAKLAIAGRAKVVGKYLLIGSGRNLSVLDIKELF